ncbi:hypothetical protein J4G48_0046010 [Bradyrhizobium barranii subsp. apii]|uniref:hypothetical protein n=1 Tax=Bradyrhizobium barranii TaxID=2992140 RepID=UPI001AA1419D|nr:hypothetical protein [Bradyrhizobium barranii]UPT96296.1 hypothetical protein J4G48_0046010 [Bradyrhizobium barranii subsp. apii]
MLEFWKSDIGKVALGGVIAVIGQLTATLVAWLKEARFAATKERKDAEYLAIRLVLVLDGLVSACFNAVHDPLMEDQDGVTENTVPDPTLTLPAEGDYKALPRRLMYEVLSMPNKLEGIKGGLAATADISGPPDYTEYYEYREEHWSKLGLRALDLIDTLCRQYKIAPPERPAHYTPRESFRDVLTKLAEFQRARNEQNAAMWAQLPKVTAASPKVP